MSWEFLFCSCYYLMLYRLIVPVWASLSLGLGNFLLWFYSRYFYDFVVIIFFYAHNSKLRSSHGAPKLLFLFIKKFHSPSQSNLFCLLCLCFQHDPVSWCGFTLTFFSLVIEFFISSITSVWENFSTSTSVFMTWIDFLISLIQMSLSCLKHGYNHYS